MKEIKAYLPESLVERLNEQAQKAGKPRGQLIRDYLLASASPSPVSPRDLHKAAVKIRQRYGYGLDRTQAESIVAAVFVELYGSQVNESQGSTSVLPS